MIIERHYDDEALIALLDSPDGLEIVARDPHLATCTSCTELLASYRDVAEILAEHAVWDVRELHAEPVPETIAALRAFADTMAMEDAQAETFIAGLLAGPREGWMANLAAHPETRTAGTVRKLIAATDRAIDTMPPDAVEITRLAVEIADHLEPSEPVLKLRAAAWRERAYALFYVGQAREALPAVQHSIGLYDMVTVDEYDRARAELVEAIVLREYEDLAGSQRSAAESAVKLQKFGDERRYQFAQMATAAVAYRAKDFRTALEIWSEVEASLSDDEYSTKSALIQNIGACYRNVGDLDNAVKYFNKAIALFDFYDIRTNRARTCWSTALLVFEQGKYDVALKMLEDARRDFESLGMLGEVTYVSLDIAETLLQLGRGSEVLSLCRGVLALQGDAGIVSPQPQMTALAYISEVTSMGQLTPHVIRTVRERLKKEGPTLQFAYAPN